MPERGFDTGFWTDPFIVKLPVEAKTLYIYLWSNDHCTQAGLYEIALETISSETKIAEDRLPELFSLLDPKVVWYPEQSLVWVKNFLRRQAKSPKFIIAAKKALNHHHIPEDIKDDFDLYNEDLLQGVVPSEHASPTKRECVIIRDRFQCQYCGKEITSAADYEMDHIIPTTRGGKDNYLNLVTSCRSCNQKKLDKLPQEVGLGQPNPSTFHGAQATYILRNDREIREKWLILFPSRYGIVESMLNNIDQHCPGILPVSVSSSSSKSGSKSGSKEVGVVKGKGELSPEEKEIIDCLVKLKGWQADEDDVLWHQGLRREYPGFTLSELKACIDYYSGRAPPKHKGLWKNRFRNWMTKKKEYDNQRPYHPKKGEKGPAPKALLED